MSTTEQKIGVKQDNSRQAFQFVDESLQATSVTMFFTSGF
jgi:hypothetical protein